MKPPKRFKSAESMSREYIAKYLQENPPLVLNEIEKLIKETEADVLRKNARLKVLETTSDKLQEFELGMKDWNSSVGVKGKQPQLALTMSEMIEAFSAAENAIDNNNSEGMEFNDQFNDD